MSDEVATPQVAAPPQEVMFSHLLASRPPKEKGFWATVTSLIFHAGLITAAVWATSALAAEADEEEEQVTLIEIEDEPPPPPPPPPPPTDQPPPPEIVDVPKGFQTLAIPDVVPPDIPPPAVGPEVSEADFSGEGVKGGRAEGKVVTAENIEAAPVFTPYTVAPELKNRNQVAQALVKHYPPLLRDAGIGGTVLVWFLIDEGGRVIRTQVQKSSGQESLDQAALKVADVMQFTPALNRDQKVKVWVALPIVFKTQ